MCKRLLSQSKGTCDLRRSGQCLLLTRYASHSVHKFALYSNSVIIMATESKRIQDLDYQEVVLDWSDADEEQDEDS